MKPKQINYCKGDSTYFGYEANDKLKFNGLCLINMHV